jgi:hypothetical protein
MIYYNTSTRLPPNVALGMNGLQHLTMGKACAVVDKHSSLLRKGVGLNEPKFYRHER